MEGNTSRRPLENQRHRLPLMAVHLQLLDENQLPLTNHVASGFLRIEKDGTYLYTCWHVVTGFDPHELVLDPTKPPVRRRFVRVSMQGASAPNSRVTVIGGISTFILPLYQNNLRPFQPIWLQDNDHIPHQDLNALGLRVPFWHDVVKILLPPDISISHHLAIDESYVFRGNMALIGPGDKCLVVGFPYGFSAFGADQPHPISLTRFVASDRIRDRRRQFLLESIGAPGMSGGPVFIERDGDLLLCGMYSGLIYPDHTREKRDGVTALGAVTDLTMLISGDLPMMQAPQNPITPPLAG